MSSTVQNELQLTPHQQEVLGVVLRNIASKNTVSALVGFAGCGKTTLIKEIAAKCGLPVLSLAPTHKAADVLSSKTGREASTIHAALGLSPDPENATGFKKSGKVKLPRNHLIVLDESSMVLRELLDMLHEVAMTLGCKILLVGDRAQLPPVRGVGGVVFEQWVMERSGLQSIARLEEIIRQAEGSAVPEVAFAYRDKTADFAMPTESVIRPKGSVFLTDFNAGVSEYVDQRTSGDIDDNDRVFLSFTNQRVNMVNQLCRERLFGPAAMAQPFFPNELVIAASSKQPDKDGPGIHNQQHARVISCQSSTIIAGDLHADVWGVTLELIDTGETVTCVASDYETRAQILRGSGKKAQELEHRFRIGMKAKGVSSEWHQIKNKQHEAFVSFAKHHNLPDSAIRLDARRRAAWRHHHDIQNTIIDLRPPYALTVHKSQGSTFRDVWLDGSSISRASMRTALMYTGLTRASQHVYLLIDDLSSDWSQ